jgi:hypothetical protein
MTGFLIGCGCAREGAAIARENLISGGRPAQPEIAMVR